MALVFEVVWPGTWIALDGVDLRSIPTQEGRLAHVGETSRLGRQLNHMASEFEDAVLALNGFGQACTALHAQMQRRPAMRADDQQWQARFEREREVRGAVEARLGSHYSSRDAVDLETKAILGRERVAAGEAPSYFVRRLPFLFARSFLHAMDMFGKFLRVLADDPKAPAKIKELSDRYRDSFPHLSGVRNTAEHLEDRSRFLGKPKGKGHEPLDLKPVNNEFIRSDGGVLVLDTLNGTKYGCTMADGEYGEVDVSPESVKVMQGILQELLNSFQWTGSPKYTPEM